MGIKINFLLIIQRQILRLFFFLKEYKKKFEQITELKKINNYNDFTLQQLKELPRLTGIIELNFKDKPFYMIKNTKKLA